MSESLNPQEPLSSSPRIFRFDDRSASKALGRGLSGRRVVIVCVLALLTIWGLLALSFRSWKARQRERAIFGAERVAPAIEPLSKLQPPLISQDDWRDAVVDTRGLLRSVTAANLLDQAEMETLRADVARRVAEAKSDTALVNLLKLWTDLARRFGPLVSRARSHRLLALPAAIAPLAANPPEGTSQDDWVRAIIATQSMLVEVVSSNKISAERIAELRDDLGQFVLLADPPRARSLLSSLWKDLPKEAGIAPKTPKPKNLSIEK